MSQNWNNQQGRLQNGYNEQGRTNVSRSPNRNSTAGTVAGLGRMSNRTEYKGKGKGFGRSSHETQWNSRQLDRHESDPSYTDNTMAMITEKLDPVVKLFPKLKII